MKTNAFLLPAAFALLVFTSNGPLQAANAYSNGNKNVQDDKKNLNAAQEKTKQMRQEVDKAQRELQKAQADQQGVGAEINKARQAALQKLAAKYGLQALIAERDAARKQVETTRNNVDARVKSQPDYQSATVASESAKQKYDQVEADKALDSDSRQGQMKDLAVTIRKPAELQRAAEDGDSDLKAAKDREKKAGSDLAAAQAALQKEIDTDPEVKAAMDKAQNASANVKKAAAAVTQAQKELSAAQAAASRDQQQLEQAKAQERRQEKKAK